MNAILNEMRHTQNRELSWLRFNERVLEEASDPSVPLYERFKFLAIFANNLDEFFMIRVGSLCDLSLLKEPHIDNKSGMTAQEQLDAIYRAVQPLSERKDQIYLQLEKELREYDVYNLAVGELDGAEKKYVQGYFESYVLPVLSPQIIDAHHPFPHLENKSLQIAVLLETRQGSRFGIIPVPKSLPRVVALPGGGMRYILLETLLVEYADQVFERYETLEKTVLSVTRNADINPDDEAYELEEDFRLRMKKALKKRARLAPVRLEIASRVSREFLQYLCDKLSLKKQHVFQSAAPLDLGYVFSLESRFSAVEKRSLLNLPFEAKRPADLDEKESMFAQIARRDILLFHPYESFSPFLRFVREASYDPAVISIKITIYRIDKQSRLAEYMIIAAENGKDVTVMLELRARFDEQNNIEWAERLEEAGCRVLYGIEGFKAHSKICLVTRRERGKLQYYTQIGTGNYNERTAALYTDFSLMTAHAGIGSDASELFKNISISNLDGHYNYFLVSPSGLKRSLLSLIDGEIEKARANRPCGILIKINSLTDRDLIDKLAEASCAGVQIDMIIRGICCLLPGIPSLTENIRVISIVGRFLEHARVYVFGRGDEKRLYIASADLMTRNTQRRVEVACPILDPRLRDRICDVLHLQLRDNQKARRLLPSGVYERIVAAPMEAFSNQEFFMRETELVCAIQAESEPRVTVWKRAARAFASLFAAGSRTS
ncbi:MAG: polyphosphate kinase 1 [Clostridiaceae bacterium]